MWNSGGQRKCSDYVTTTQNAESDNYEPKCQYANNNTMPYKASLWEAWK